MRPVVASLGVALGLSSAACVILGEPHRDTVAWSVAEVASEGRARGPAVRRSAFRAIGPCAVASIEVVRSGKEGIGVIVALRGATADVCTVHELRVEVVLSDGTRASGSRPLPARSLTASVVTESYVAVPFDSNDAWNRGVRRGEARLVGELGSATFPIEHRVEGDR